jgi:hypothetical protein
MRRPDGETSAVVTAPQRADTAGDSQAARVWTPHLGLWAAPVHDEGDAVLCRRARRQGFWLMIASSAAMIVLVVGIWLLVR